MSTTAATRKAAAAPGAAVGRSGSGAEDVFRFALVGVQLLLILLVIRAYHVDEAFGFVTLGPVILIGFAVNAWLPPRLRPPFFVIVSVVAAGVVLGPVYGAALVAACLGLIALCHAPVAYGARVGLVLLAGAVLAAIRIGWLPAPSSVSDLVVPVLAAMFMFRVVLYLYALRDQTSQVSVWQRIGYFFLLPNVCFLLFPVVDYKTFRRTYYDRDAFEIYQKGVSWIVRGVVHILLYRVVYLHLLPDPQTITGLGGVVQHVVATYSLYLRISGQFHIVIGILCLFGFNLPETHHLYFLASSFTDYWRRINIYYKDFMTKVVYYPTMLYCRRWGMTAGMIFATSAVFLATWLLHSYQWFWLHGTFPLRWTDGLFWGILGLLVVANSLYEARASHRRKVGHDEWDATRAVRYSAQVVGMFVVISTIWSLWSAPSVAVWVRIMARATASGPMAWSLLTLALAGLIALGVAVQFVQKRVRKSDLPGHSLSFTTSAGYAGATAALLLMLGQSSVQARLAGQGSLGASSVALLASVQTEDLNTTDVERMQRGYYEGFLAAPSYTSALWRLTRAELGDWNAFQRSAWRRRDDLLGWDVLPDIRFDWNGEMLSTNRWSMRDRDYDLAKPPGTFRIALLGASYTMGVGVGDDQVFEVLTEARLNQEPPSTSYRHYEILNFSRGGYGVAQNAILLREAVLAFQPDAVVLAVSPVEAGQFALQVPELLRRHGSVGVPALDSILAKAGVLPEMTVDEVADRIRPVVDEVVRWSLLQMVAACRQAGIVPAALYVPLTSMSDIMNARGLRFLDIAADLGFVTMSMEDVFDGWEPDLIQLAAADSHPTPLGHRLMSDRFYQTLIGRAVALGMGASESSIPAASRQD